MKRWKVILVWCVSPIVLLWGVVGIMQVFKGMRQSGRV